MNNYIIIILIFILNIKVIILILLFIYIYNKTNSILSLLFFFKLLILNPYHT